MPRKRILILFLFLTALLLAVNAFAQVGKPGGTPEPAPQEVPEQPPPILFTEINDGLLTVELSDVQFGDVIKEIAVKAGFKVAISGDVYGKKLNTKFNNIELERGVERLLTLIREKNYTLNYDSSGNIAGLDIYGAAQPPAVGKNQPQPPGRVRPQRPAIPAPIRTPAIAPVPAPVAAPAPAPAAPPVQKNVPQNLRRILSPMRARQQEAMKARRQAISDANTNQQNAQPDEAAQPEVQPEENVEEVPYVPSPKNPQYVPPRAQ